MTTTRSPRRRRRRTCWDIAQMRALESRRRRQAKRNSSFAESIAMSLGASVTAQFALVVGQSLASMMVARPVMGRREQTASALPPKPVETDDDGLPPAPYGGDEDARADYLRHPAVRRATEKRMRHSYGELYDEMSGAAERREQRRNRSPRRQAAAMLEYCEWKLGRHGYLPPGALSPDCLCILSPELKAFAAAASRDEVDALAAGLREARFGDAMIRSLLADASAKGARALSLFPGLRVPDVNMPPLGLLISPMPNDESVPPVNDGPEGNQPLCP